MVKMDKPLDKWKIHYKNHKTKTNEQTTSHMDRPLDKNKLVEKLTNHWTWTKTYIKGQTLGKWTRSQTNRQHTKQMDKTLYKWTKHGQMDKTLDI